MGKRIDREEQVRKALREPAGTVEYAEALVGIRRENDHEDDGNRRKKEVRGKGTEWTEDLEKLVEFGRQLDWPSKDPFFWRVVAGVSSPQVSDVSHQSSALSLPIIAKNVMSGAMLDDPTSGSASDRGLGPVPQMSRKGKAREAAVRAGEVTRPQVGEIACRHFGEVACPHIGACPYVEGVGCPCRTLWKMPEGDAWIERHLMIRTKLGEVRLMKLNPAQLRYSYDCAEKKAKGNIVLKARQMGITSYVAARFFVQTVTRPGTLTMLVAHDRESAEGIFRIVQPGRMKIAEDRIRALENNDIRRGVYDRLVSAAIATIISAGIAMHDRFLK